MVDFSINTIAQRIIRFDISDSYFFLIKQQQKKIQWKTVLISILIQFVIAVLILKFH